MSPSHPELYGGGHARSGSGSIHVSFRSGSRGAGASAAAAYDYITRERQYDDANRDPAVFTESDNMPTWAVDDPHRYWDAADLYERANGRLYVSGDFALPRGLERDEQVELARAFARSLTDEERLPYTLAIHAGLDSQGREHNPHAHLMLSERRNDGVEREAREWFRRANTEHPERGGAAKSRAFHGPEWVEKARERWAELTNAVLEKKGRDDRVDHRSYSRQGLDRQPDRHVGPASINGHARGASFDRPEEVLSSLDLSRALQEVDQEIAQLTGERGEIERDPDSKERRQSWEVADPSGDREDDSGRAR